MVVGAAGPRRWRRTGNRRGSARFWTRSNCTLCARATTRTHGPMPSWKNSWWRWLVWARESSGSGSKTSAARTRRRRSSWSSSFSRRRSVSQMCLNLYLRLRAVRMFDSCVGSMEFLLRDITKSVTTFPAVNGTVVKHSYGQNNLVCKITEYGLKYWGSSIFLATFKPPLRLIQVPL